MGIGIIFLIILIFIALSFLIGWANLLGILFLILIAYLLIKFLAKRLWL